MDVDDINELDELDEQALEDAILGQPSKALLTVKDPNSPLVRVRRRQLTQRFYQNRHYMRQLQVEQNELAEQLAQLGGQLGNYFSLRDQLKPLTPNERNKIALRMQKRERNMVSATSQFLFVWWPTLLAGVGAIVGAIIIVAILILITA